MPPSVYSQQIGALLPARPLPGLPPRRQPWAGVPRALKTLGGGARGRLSRSYFSAQGTRSVAGSERWPHPHSPEEPQICSGRSGYLERVGHVRRAGEM